LNSRTETSRSSTKSAQAKRAFCVPHLAIAFRLMMHAMRPTGVPSRRASQYSASASSKAGFLSLRRVLSSSNRSGGIQLRFPLYSEKGNFTKRFRSFIDSTRLMLMPM